MISYYYYRFNAREQIVSVTRLTTSGAGGGSHDNNLPSGHMWLGGGVVIVAPIIARS